jgi:hypothetical protein
LSYPKYGGITHDQGVLHLSFSGCSPAVSMDVKLVGCREWLNQSLAVLENEDSIKKVILGFRHNAFLYGDHAASYPEVPDIYPSDRFEEIYAKKIDDLRAAYWLDHQTLVKRLLAAEKTVYLLYPIPELPIHISQLTSPFSIFSQEPLYDLEKITSKQYYLNRNKHIIQELDKLSRHDDVHAIRPYDVLCARRDCPAVYNGQALYFDDDHLSAYGALTLMLKSGLVE